MNNLTSFEFCDEYPVESPFSPGIKYPEYPFSDISSKPNKVYDVVRKHLYNLGLDKDNYGKESWNPFKEFCLTRKKILIKPNWVKHVHPHNENIWCLITHPSFIRVILDYIFIETKGNCSVVIGDSPVQEADFNKIIEISQIKELQYYFVNHGLNIEIEDFRYERVLRDRRHLLIKTEVLSKDPGKSVVISLAGSSLHSDIDSNYKRYRVTDYDKKTMREHHRPGHHEYLLSKTAIECDFFINIPKAKTHRKAGVTLSLKNLVGINCSKDWLPHHRQGVKSQRADEYKDFFLFQWLSVYFGELSEMQKKPFLRKFYFSLSKFVFAKLHNRTCKILHLIYYSEGSWYGNDTIWRTCLDLNRILLYTDRRGKLGTKIEKDYLTIIDGVIGGEKEGPLEPTPVNSNFVIASLNPLLADYVAARCMGLNPMRIPIIKYCFSDMDFPICNIKSEEIEVVSSSIEMNGSANSIAYNKKFIPSQGWEKHIEL
jgi:uncharacterized protein (DUF362 family)